MQLPNFLGFLRKCGSCHKLGKPGMYMPVIEGIIDDRGARQKTVWRWICAECEDRQDAETNKYIGELIDSGVLKVRAKED
jgi:hypothetical protein